MHTYIHLNKQTYIHRPYIHTYIHTYVRPYAHACMHVCMHACAYTRVLYTHTMGELLKSSGGEGRKESDEAKSRAVGPNEFLQLYRSRTYSDPRRISEAKGAAARAKQRRRVMTIFLSSSPPSSSLSSSSSSSSSSLVLMLSSLDQTLRIRSPVHLCRPTCFTERFQGANS